jgi:hypothetical protein
LPANLYARSFLQALEGYSISRKGIIYHHIRLSMSSTGLLQDKMAGLVLKIFIEYPDLPRCWFDKV